MKKAILLSLVIIMFTMSFITPSKVSAKVVRKNGSYITWLMKKPNNEIDAPYAKKMIIKKNKMIVYGRINYSSFKGWNVDILRPKKKTFIFSKKCKFYKGWSTKNGKRISKKKWKKLAKKIDKGNITKRMISWDIKYGKIVKMFYKD